MMKKHIYSAISIVFFFVLLSFTTYHYTRWTAPKSADKIKNPLKGNAKATAAGKKTFNQMCAICHGKSGKGNGIAGASLNPKPANFWKTAVQTQTDGAIFWKMTNGKPPMAAYKTSLSETKRWQLVNYIRTFSKVKKVATPPKPVVKVETAAEKALRIAKENDKQFTILTIKADTAVAHKQYTDAKTLYTKALKIKPNELAVTKELKKLDALIVAANKREKLKQEIKTELKAELKTELKAELKQEIKAEILQELKKEKQGNGVPK